MFALSNVGCGDISGECAHGVCKESYYKEKGSPDNPKPAEGEAAKE